MKFTIGGKKKKTHVIVRKELVGKVGRIESSLKQAQKRGVLARDPINEPPQKVKKFEERESRKAGLKKELDAKSCPIGFKLLSKMGYQLERNNTPIEVEEKIGRRGLGAGNKLKEREEAAALRLSQKEQIQKQQLIEMKEYNQLMFECREIGRFLRKSKRVCQEMDERHQIERHRYWAEEKSEMSLLEDPLLVRKPMSVRGKETKEELQQKRMDLGMELDEICCYLRDNYFYCVFCGSCFHDKLDLESECPGFDMKSHEDVI